MKNNEFDWLSDVGPLRTAQDMWQRNTYQEQVVFHLPPAHKDQFNIAAGAALLADHIKRFRFSPDVIQRIGQITDPSGRCIFQESFLNHLQRLRLRVYIDAAVEGTLLVPGEPLLVVKGPLIQVQLMESAFRKLIFESSFWATQAAKARWDNKDWDEDDAPPLPVIHQNIDGWKTRAAYIGGAEQFETSAAITVPNPDELLHQINYSNGEPLDQIRRLYKINAPLGDLWLTDKQEGKASVSKKTTSLKDIGSQTTIEVKMTRFQNLYQPLLIKGHPVMSTPKLGYLRQRTLKQLEAFGQLDLGNYACGWQG